MIFVINDKMIPKQSITGSKNCVKNVLTRNCKPSPTIHVIIIHKTYVIKETNSLMFELTNGCHN